MSQEPPLSQRGHVTLNVPSPLVKFSQRIFSDVYHPDNNPQGFIDLGTAENKLMADIILPKLASIKEGEDEPSLMYYFNLMGLKREVLKKFIEHRFHPSYDIDPNQLVINSGTTAVLETLAFAVAEAGDSEAQRPPHERKVQGGGYHHYSTRKKDCILVPTPYYYRITNDLIERAKVDCYPVPLHSKDENGEEFHLSFEKLERAYNKATSEGRVVSGLLLINPHNPLGDVYTKQQLMDALNFANRYELHVIVDEIYALSVWDKDTDFTSVLSLSVPDPHRTHFVWGFSKDLGLSGYRCGILHSRNPDVIRYAVNTAIYHQTPALIQKKLESLIADQEWLDQVYFPTYHQRLRDGYSYVSQRLHRLGVNVHRSTASFFVWADMSKFLKQETFEAEEELQDRFMDGKIYILGGKSSYNAQPGWFRIVASNQIDILEKGLDRIEAVLTACREEKQQTQEIIRL